MKSYEENFANLVAKILTEGEVRETRNSATKAIFGEKLVVDCEEGVVPLLHGRKMFYKGVLGELAAMLRGPKTIQDFKDYGCNYWDTWADVDGNIKVDYGNAWLDFNGVDQLARLRETLLKNPTDRRMLVSGWRPDLQDSLSLPCCHLLYQWYVRDGEFLDMIWYQRSVDTMVGLPSDVIFAWAWNVMLANDVGLRPGRITFMLGDTHIYKEHRDVARIYLNRVNNTLCEYYPEANYKLHCQGGKKFTDFVPQDIEIYNYNPLGKLELELLA